MSNFNQNSELNHIQKNTFPKCPLAACTQNPQKWLVHLPVVPSAPCSHLFSLHLNTHNKYKDLWDRRFSFLCLFVLWQLTLTMSITNYAILTLRTVRAQSRLQLSFRKGGHNSHTPTNSILCFICETAALKLTKALHLQCDVIPNSPHKATFSFHFWIHIDFYLSSTCLGNNIIKYQ